jgi:hypothetical protein
VAALDQTALFTAQTATGDSAVAARSSSSDVQSPGAIVVTNVGTGSPTFTFTIQGSVDGVQFFNIPYALVATPSTYVVAAITTTTSATITYLLQANQPWQFVKLNISALTTETVNAAAYL